MAPQFAPSRLKAARNAAGLTMAELAQLIGKSRWAVRMWESGERRPSPEMLAAIATALGVTVGSFFGETDPPNLQASLILEHIRRVVDSAPPLTTDQRDLLTAIFSSAATQPAERRAS